MTQSTLSHYRRFEGYKSMWVRRVSEYCDRYGRVYFAKVTPVVPPHRRRDYPRPDKVEHLISVVLEPGGYRHYCFQTEQQRDDFVAKYSEFAMNDGGLIK